MIPRADIHVAAASAAQLRRRRYLTRAIHLSLVVGVFILGVKIYAYQITASVAILSDATESVVHFFMVCFAVYSVWLAHKPPDRDHLYGHDRINFFSVGFEGAMIVAAALFILYEAVTRLWLGDLRLQRVEAGIGYILLAMVVNTILGGFLLHYGKKWNSIVVEANGRHVLADGMTSLGVVAGLGLSQLSGWLVLDPLVGVLVALHILWLGAGLIYRSVGGLMDSADPRVDAELRAILETETRRHGIHFHFLRHRNAGNRLFIDFHLLFDNETTIARAHDIAMKIENAIAAHFDMPTEITSHFEPVHGHDEAHRI